MASYADPETTAYYDEPYAGAMRRGFLESAAALARQPMPIPVQQVAGLDPYQMQARALAGGLGGFAPYLQQGAGMAQQGFGTMQAGAGMYNPYAAQQFYNPYEDQVVQGTIEQMNKQNQAQAQADRARAVSSGAFGGSRGRLMEQEREQAFGRGLTQAVGGLRQQGYSQAQQAAQNAAQGLGQIGTQMGQMGTGFANLGMLGQQGLGSMVSTFNQLGGQGRDIQQQMYDAQYNAANRMAVEPWKRMQAYQGMLGMLPRGSYTTYGSQPGTGLANYMQYFGMFG
tara:strand:+ start:2914 stop:3762 length:849 start_codon:yes stop_codon:yes gene_type:complete